MHSTLLIGPYDWDSERLPQVEFRERIEALWARLADQNYRAVVVYGDSRNHAELGYLSNFVPKLGPAFMFIPREGEPRLLVSGAPNMLPAARRLSWIEKVEPLRDAGKSVLQWIKESAPLDKSAGQSIMLIGGDAMRAALYRPFVGAFGARNIPADGTASLRSLMRHKRPRELAAIREGCAMLTAAKNALQQAARSDASVTAAILQAEQVAYRAGAQDVRTLFSLDGGRTLRPFDAPVNSAVDPLHVYIAVRHAGYWVEGLVMIASSPHPVGARVHETLKSVIEIAKAGLLSRDLVTVAEEKIKPYAPHPMTAGNIGNSIGCFLEEAPRLSATSDDKLESGAVYTLRVGAADGGGQHAIASAMILIGAERTEVLWSEDR